VLGVSIVGLLWAQIFPTAINDSARWVRIPGIGLTIQPSEIAKLGIVMYLARVIAFEQVNNYCSDKALMKVGIYTVFVLFLIFKENFSTSLLLGTVCLAMLFIGRLRWKTMFVLLGSLIVLASLFLVIIYTYPKSDDFARVATIKHRLDSFFVPGKEGSDTYQVDQSKIAIARGGLYGVGPGRSEQRNFLPNPFSDFIYAIIIEEYGLLIGGAVVLLIYLIILYRVGLIVRRCTRMFPALLVAGLGLTIVMQSLMHMMVCVGLFPVTGQPLPLVSMGGTSILLTGVAFGMIQSVAHTFSEAGRQEERERKEE
jgi:cell division protein FtsW